MNIILFVIAAYFVIICITMLLEKGIRKSFFNLLSTPTKYWKEKKEKKPFQRVKYALLFPLWVLITFITCSLFLLLSPIILIFSLFMKGKKAWGSYWTHRKRKKKIKKQNNKMKQVKDEPKAQLSKDVASLMETTRTYINRLSTMKNENEISNIFTKSAINQLLDTIASLATESDIRTLVNGDADDPESLASLLILMGDVDGETATIKKDIFEGPFDSILTVVKLLNKRLNKLNMENQGKIKHYKIILIDPKQLPHRNKAFANSMNSLDNFFPLFRTGLSQSGKIMP